MVYAGIGSRETPPSVLKHMRRFAEVMTKKGHYLRSGAAKGADQAFMKGAEVDLHYSLCYKPWFSYESGVRAGHIMTEPKPEAFTLAAQYHPAWDRCGRGVKALHARNMHIILGSKLDHPVDFVICWTKGGQGQGGTGQALRLAHALNIPVCDLGAAEDIDLALEEVVKWVDGVS